ncbi:MAG: ATP-binding cassette domain-containing protein [Bacteroidota bacterium]
MRNIQANTFQLSLQKRLKGVGGEMNLSFALKCELGTTIGLMGASGAGKSSVLKMIAGLMKPDQGRISLGQEVWYDHQKNLSCSPQQRRPGFVMQDYALFPNMSVRENIVFACEQKPENEKLNHWLEKAGLLQLADQKPIQLSGGQKQRLALVRALITEPRLLLLDEPLAAQDPATRRQWQSDLIAWTQSVPHMTTILVSHDPKELMRLADLVVEIKDGKSRVIGSPLNLFSEINTHLEAEIIAVDPLRKKTVVLLGEQKLNLSWQETHQTGQMIRFTPAEIHTQ